MKLVVLGGSGLIGTNLVNKLHARNHHVFAASRSSGVDATTGAGLSEAMNGADVVVDVTNSPSFADDAVMQFFQTTTRHVMEAAAKTGVKHFVALSVVGADRIPESGYMRAKLAQESLILAGKVPCTIVRATQFFEFAGAIADSSVINGEIRLPTAKMQPMAADDVAAALTDIALAAPVNGVMDIAGPDMIPMDELARRFLRAMSDPRSVVTDDNARYFGAMLTDNSLTPSGSARLGPTRFDRWLSTLTRSNPT